MDNPVHIVYLDRVLVKKLADTSYRAFRGILGRSRSLGSNDAVKKGIHRNDVGEGASNIETYPKHRCDPNKKRHRCVDGSTGAAHWLVWVCGQITSASSSKAVATRRR